MLRKDRCVPFMPLFAAPLAAILGSWSWEPKMYLLKGISMACAVNRSDKRVHKRRRKFIDNWQCRSEKLEEVAVD